MKVKPEELIKQLLALHDDEYFICTMDSAGFGAFHIACTALKECLEYCDFPDEDYEINMSD